MVKLTLAAHREFYSTSRKKYFLVKSKLGYETSRTRYAKRAIFRANKGPLLMLISTMTELQKYPRLGAYWEGFALEEVIRVFQAAPQECFFWATHADAELDLLLLKGRKRLGFEFKYTDHPKVTKSMYIAQRDLKLDHVALLYPGDRIFPLEKGITAYGLETLATGEFERKFEMRG